MTHPNLSGCIAKEGGFQEETQRDFSHQQVLASRWVSPGPPGPHRIQNYEAKPCCQCPWGEHSNLYCPPLEFHFQQQGFLLLSFIQHTFVEHLLCAKHCAGVTTGYKAGSLCPSETISPPPKPCPCPSFSTMKTVFKQHSPPARGTSENAHGSRQFPCLRK